MEVVMVLAVLAPIGVLLLLVMVLEGIIASGVRKGINSSELCRPKGDDGRPLPLAPRSFLSNPFAARKPIQPAARAVPGMDEKKTALPLGNAAQPARRPTDRAPQRPATGPTGPTGNAGHRSMS